MSRILVAYKFSEPSNSQRHFDPPEARRSAWEKSLAIFQEADKLNLPGGQYSLLLSELGFIGLKDGQDFVDVVVVSRGISGSRFSKQEREHQQYEGGKLGKKEKETG